jgi:chlorinating enzyme
MDDATFENGCMHFLKGTQRTTVPILRTATELPGNPPEVAKLIAGQGRFALAKIVLDLEITPEMIVPMPLKAGQCVIFSERCIHGSPPNNSPNRRFGFVFRTIKPNVQVYRDEKVHSVGYLKQQYDLKNWGCALIRGEDKYHLNKLAQQPTKEREFVGASGD